LQAKIQCGFDQERTFNPYVVNSPILSIDPYGLIKTSPTPSGCCKDKEKNIDDGLMMLARAVKEANADKR